MSLTSRRAIAGILIVAVGLVALPAPGPGTLVVAFGGALLARESVVVARAMDWIELRARDTLDWVRGRRRHRRA